MTTHSSQTVEARAARLSVAPMMDYTDRHCRYFHRVLSKNTLLYTEMVTAPAIVRGGALELLDHDPSEHPVAVQLGGSEPDELRAATEACANAGFKEVNLNVGCPSDRVQSGCFGAVLMRDPDLVARCVTAMQDVQGIEVTVKCRIGVDDQDPAVALPDFLERVSAAGVNRFTIHARKAWLKGLNTKENRTIPPLDYPLVYAMKQQFAHLHLSINGGVGTLDEAQAHLDHGMDGVMIGRAAYHNPFQILAAADGRLYGGTNRFTADIDAVNAMRPYIAAHLGAGGRIGQVTRHMLGLFAGQHGAKAWRRTLSIGATEPGKGLELLDEGLMIVAAQQAEIAAHEAAYRASLT